MSRILVACVCVLALTSIAPATTYYVSPSGIGDGLSEGASMSWTAWKAVDRTSDSCYFAADMDSTISEDFYWPACQGYWAKYIQVYANHSIGWRLGTTYYEIFQFANGDIGVVDSGSGVVITALVPSPTEIDVSGTLYDCHGAMVDPVVDWSQSFHEKSGSYSAAANVGLGIAAGTPYTLTSGHTMVHSYGKTVADGEISWVYEAAALHCVDAVPATLSFRPTYAGGSAVKTIHAASEVNLDRLADLTIVGTGYPSKSGTEATCRSLWLEKFPAWTNRYIHPVGSRPAYGTSLSAAMAYSMLWTNTNQTDADKVVAVRMLVQAGIDAWGLITSSSLGRQVFPADGGHSQSKMRWAYAAWLLNDATMLAGLQKTGDYILTTALPNKYWPTDYITSSESQSYIVAQECILTPPWPVAALHGASSSGTVNVTHGSTVVTGNGTNWTAETYRTAFVVTTSGGFADDDLAFDPAAKAYGIASVDSATQITLSRAYTGPTANNKYYRMGDYICYGHGSLASFSDYGPAEDMEEFTAEHLGMPTWGEDWGSDAFFSPTASWSGKGFYTGATNIFTHKYQPTFVQSVPAHVLAMLAMGMYGVWNHDASIYYADRTATVNDRDADWLYDWSRDMWDTYRSQYSPAPWTPKCHTPVPATAATGVATSQVVSWYDGNGRPTGTSCNVYFGTNPASLSQVETQSIDYQYTPTLAAGTTYYWRVDEVCPGGTYPGDVWSFTTEGEAEPGQTKYLLLRKGS